MLGCDFAGTIVALGSSPTNKGLKIGSHVQSFVHGGKFPDKGSFAQYLYTAGDMLFAIDGMNGAEAATFGVGYSTAAMVGR